MHSPQLKLHPKASQYSIFVQLSHSKATPNQIFPIFRLFTQKTQIKKPHKQANQSKKTLEHPLFSKKNSHRDSPSASCNGPLLHKKVIW